MPAPTLLPGEFAIRTEFTNNYVSYSPATDSLNTSATSLTATEKFKITTWFPGFSLIQTLLDQQYVIVTPQGVVELGGLDSSGKSLLTLIGPRWGLDFPIGLGNFQIKTHDGSYLIAVDGGGQTSNAFLADQPPNQYFSNFWIVKCGDLGNGYRYAIRAALPQERGIGGPVGNFLTAHKGGGQTQNGVIAYPKNGLTSDGIFTLIRINAELGQYALQTSNGFNYVTAVDGGGLSGGDNLHTDATRVDGWEYFQIVDQLDGTYAIQTASGYYLAVAYERPSSGTGISTDISSPDLAPGIGYTAKFEFIMLPNQLGITGLT
jgi:hypothetical protein